MSRFSILVILIFLQNNILHAQQSDTPYTGLYSSGELPSDFLLTTSSKIESYKSANKEEFNSSKDIILKSFYGLDEILLSGKVNFGDPVTTYINKVADEVLKYQPELRNQVKVYTLKSPELNAISAPHGFIFINTAVLAYLENEAQLAYILCHEFAHFKVNHWKNTISDNKNVIDGKGIYGSLSLDERIDLYFKRSHEKELEADSIGIKLYLQSGYDPSEIIKTLNAELYADLPFGNKLFDIGFFNAENFKVPEVFFKDSLTAISGIEDTKDNYKRHPNISKRKESIKRILGDQPGTGSAFLVSENEFSKLSDLCRFECIRLELLERNYSRAIYDAYLLMDKYPGNDYLLISVAKALYGLSKFRNNDEFHLVTSPFSKIEGESQQLYYFLRQINPVQLNTLALKYIHNLKNLYPKVVFLDVMETDLINDLVSFHKVKFTDFFDKYRAFESPSRGELKNLKSDEILIWKKRCADFYLNAFCNERNDTSLAAKFESAQVLELKKSTTENISFREKEKQNQIYEDNIRNSGLPVKYDKALVIDPAFVNLNILTEKSFENSEKYKMLLNEVVSENNRDMKTPVDLLSMRFLNFKSIDEYNQLSMLKELREEILTGSKTKLLPLSIPHSTGNDENILVCFPVILEKDGLQYYYLSYYDYQTGDLIFENNARYVTFKSVKALFQKDLQILTKN